MTVVTPVHRLSLAGLFAAMITVSTLILKVPGITGYYHLGDGFIFLAAVTLPLGPAVAAAAVGSALADVLGGYAVWAPWTLVIKGLAALATGWVGSGRSGPRAVLGMTAGAAVIVSGYAAATWILYGWPAVPAETYFNLGQTGVGIILASLLMTAVRRALGSQQR